MGLISRHPGAPFSAGEVVDGSADLEPDIANLFNEFNGKVTNLNVASAAAIAGSKLGSGTIPGSKVAAGTLNTTEMAVAAETSTDVTGDAMTTSATLVDVPTLSSVTVTPASATDILICEFLAFYVAGGGSVGVYGWTFSIGGADLGLLAISRPLLAGAQATVSVRWAQIADTTDSVEIIPRYLRVDSTAGGTFLSSGIEANKHLTVQVFPGA